jgi:hypothetical protein
MRYAAINELASSVVSDDPLIELALNRADEAGEAAIADDAADARARASRPRAR